MVSTAYEMGWSEIDNGRLLSAAELECDAMITMDQSIRYQQNRAGRQLGIIVLPTTNWRRIQLHQREILSTINNLHPGEIVELKFK
ncbi:MAG: hypothetical protein WA268_26185 [Xanthobacteraceae bacterium]